MLTKENAKYHCRTCLIEFSAATAKPVEFVNLATNIKLQQLIKKYIENREFEYVQEYPQNVCFSCYNKLEDFERFQKLAKQCTKKLHSVLDPAIERSKATLKYECEITQAEIGKRYSDDDDDKFLLKNMLMEPEAILLEAEEMPPNTPLVELQEPDPFEVTVPRKLRCRKSAAETSASDLNKICSKRLTKMKQKESSSEGDSDAFANEEPMHEMKLKTAIHKDIKNDYTSDESKSSDATDEDYMVAEQKNQKAALRRKKRVLAKKSEIPAETLQTENTQVSATAEVQMNKIKKKKKKKNVKNDRDFRCEQCNHCFLYKYTLEAHVRKIHQGNKRPYHCERCDKSYMYISGLLDHVKEIHETPTNTVKPRPYVCEYCGEAFLRAKTLRHHVYRHTGEKPYVCEECGTGFRQLFPMQKHRKTHFSNNINKPSII